jgi:hypothetical protein
MSPNPDRNFSTDYLPDQEQEDLRALLPQSAIADLFDLAIRERVGKAISRAAFRPAKPGWVEEAPKAAYFRSRPGGTS